MTTHAPVRIGVVGGGFGARIVAPIFAATEGCEIVDVVSARDESAVRDLCARPDVDLVTLHSPPFLHRDHARWAIDAGRAVLCEKPFGRNESEAAEMLALAQAAGVLHLLNFEFRQHPGRRQLRAFVSGGAVGAVEHVHCSLFSAGSRAPLRHYGWLFDASRGGGWVGAWGSHTIDFVRWAFGEIVEAGADLRTTIRERPDVEGRLHTCTAEDAFTAWLVTETGVTVTIDSTFVAPANVPLRITVIGSDGVLESVGDHRITLRDESGLRQVFELEHTDGDPHIVPMRHWTPVVRDAVAQAAAGPDVPTFVDGLACSRVMEGLRAPFWRRQNAT